MASQNESLVVSSEQVKNLDSSQELEVKMEKRQEQLAQSKVEIPTNETQLNSSIQLLNLHLNLNRHHLNRRQLNENHESNKWHLIHYFKNNINNENVTQHNEQKTPLQMEQQQNTWQLAMPTFDQLPNDIKNLNDNSIERQNDVEISKLQKNASQIALVDEQNKQKLFDLIKSIKSKLVTQNQQRRSSSNMQINQMKPQQQHAGSFDHLAQLSCDSGEMIVRLNFTEPFKGIVYPDHNRLSPCRFFGDGHHNYELRLPLRGCGTRQVAPRVFVNDVIVRFHKTLELEEDEVKTLICRYPPPLDITSGSNAPASNQQAAGNGLVHELPSNSNRPGLELLDGGGHVQQNQFELFEPPPIGAGSGSSSGNRPTNRLGNSQLETLGELSLTAPSGGRQRQPLADLINLTPAERILLRQAAGGARTYNDNLLLAPSSADISSLSAKQRTNSRLLFNSNNSNGPFDLFQPPTGFDLASATNDTRGGGAGGGGGGGGTFFDRLTSVELLFLISSLMFLVMLAFGLAGSYYCFNQTSRRRRTRASGAHLTSATLHNQSGGAGVASGLLSRRRRHFNSPTRFFGTGTGGVGALPAAVAGIAQFGTHAGGSRYQSSSGQLLAKPATGAQGQTTLYNPAAHRPAFYYQQQQQQVGPPSPPSPDDSDFSGQNLLPVTTNSALTGRRKFDFDYLQPTATNATNGAHYRSSTLRPNSSGHQNQLVHLQQVVGRRQASDAANHCGAHHYQPGERPEAGGHLQQNLSLNQQQQQQRRKHMLPGEFGAGATATLGRRTARPVASFSTASREPLLRTANPSLAHDLHSDARVRAANQSLAQMRHARSLQQLREKEDASACKEFGELAKFGPAHALGADWQRKHNQFKGDNSERAHQQQERRDNERAHDFYHLNDHKIKMKQQQHRYRDPAAAAAAVSRDSKQATRQVELQVAKINPGDDFSTSPSDSSSTCSSDLILGQTNEQNNATSGQGKPTHLQQQQQHGRVPSKLILKSIEDSFVTNFTEIYEQEYKHRDARTPFSLAEGRATSNNKNRKLMRETARCEFEREDDEDDEDDDKDDATTSGAAKGAPHLSSQTNLRSLTELDVNFAKSMLRPVVAAAATTATTATTREESTTSPPSSPIVRLDSNKPPSGQTSERQQQTGELVAGTTRTRTRTRTKTKTNPITTTPDGDLVISPEYNVGQRLHLKGESRDQATGSPGRESHESISYV